MCLFNPNHKKIRMIRNIQKNTLETETEQQKKKSKFTITQKQNGHTLNFHNLLSFLD